MEGRESGRVRGSNKGSVDIPLFNARSTYDSYARRKVVPRAVGPMRLNYWGAVGKGGGIQANIFVVIERSNIFCDTSLPRKVSLSLPAVLTVGLTSQPPEERPPRPPAGRPQSRTASGSRR